MNATSKARSTALESLRANLISERARKRFSQDDLAQKSGVSRPTISRIERAVGDVKLDVVDRLAGALDVAVADLFRTYGSGAIADDEIARRAAEPKADYVDARDFLAALDEADDGAPSAARYSRAGRPALAR